MNQMVASLYTATTVAPSASQGNATPQTTTDSHLEEEPQTKRKQSSEKSVKQVKRKKPSEATVANDTDGRLDLLSYQADFRLPSGPDVEFSTTTFADFAAAESFKEVNHRRSLEWWKYIHPSLEFNSSNLFHSPTRRFHPERKNTPTRFSSPWPTRCGKVSVSPSIIGGTAAERCSRKNALFLFLFDW